MGRYIFRHMFYILYVYIRYRVPGRDCGMSQGTHPQAAVGSYVLRGWAGWHGMALLFFLIKMTVEMLWKNDQPDLIIFQGWSFFNIV